MKIKVHGDYFDDEVIAFVRKLNKKTKDFELPDGTGTIPGGKTHVLQLKHGYSLDGVQGRATSIFLTQVEGESVLDQLEFARNSKIDDHFARKAKA